MLTQKRSPAASGASEPSTTPRNYSRSPLASTSAAALANALPTTVRRLLANPPDAGRGVHRWLFRTARALHRCGLSEGDCETVLTCATAHCGRDVPNREIDDAVCNSRPDRAHEHRLPRWPNVNHEQREAVIRDHGGLADLWEASRLRLQDDRSHAEEWIDLLFPGNPLLCVGKSQGEFQTLAREDWRGTLSRFQFVVPNPMTARFGGTKDGRRSAHSLSNTGPRRFLVVESDFGTVDEHAAILLHLGTLAPLVLAVHSGGKSLHGWFLVEGQPEEKVLRLFRYAICLGADPATWCRSQFVRMPDGLRPDGKDPDTGQRCLRRQTVFFCNPKPLEVAP